MAGGKKPKGCVEVGCHGRRRARGTSLRRRQRRNHPKRNLIMPEARLSFPSVRSASPRKLQPQRHPGGLWKCITHPQSIRGSSSTAGGAKPTGCVEVGCHGRRMARGTSLWRRQRRNHPKRNLMMPEARLTFPSVRSASPRKLQQQRHPGGLWKCITHQPDY